MLASTLSRHTSSGRAFAVSAAGLDDRIELRPGVMHDLPYPDAQFDFVWCRDVIEQVDALPSALADLRRVMRPSGRLLVYTTFATDRLDGGDAEMMRHHLGNIEENLDRTYVESVFDAGGLTIERREVIGSTWQEHLAERTQPASKALPRLSRLRRQRDDLVARHGEDVVEHIEANLHWEVFILLGKLEPVVYLLKRR